MTPEQVTKPDFDPIMQVVQSKEARKTPREMGSRDGESHLLITCMSSRTNAFLPISLPIGCSAINFDSEGL